ncbi:MAG: hypothetical protein D6715_14220 [Calditrichaeota bacterium]|nr:MAG: hypothetical protein D6715_14220 [Calditrichota bacterium]
MAEQTPAQSSKAEVVAIHQPNYLPYLGFFYKMARCDVFVYLDAVQYPRGRSFANRNRIKTPNGVTFLTIPVHIPRGREGRVLYTEVAIADLRWRDKHLKTVEMAYKRAPFFEPIFQRYQDTLLAHDQFVELNIALIETFAGYLGITCRRVRLSQLLSSFGQKSQLIVDICTALGAGIYLSGTGGGREYNDEALLKANGIELRYSDFVHPVYPQLWGDFVPNLCILDLLFNCGPESRTILLGGADDSTLQHKSVNR